MTDLLLLAPKDEFYSMVDEARKSNFNVLDIYQPMLLKMRFEDRINVFRGRMMSAKGVIIHPHTPLSLFYLGLAYEARSGKGIVWLSGLEYEVDFNVEWRKDFGEALKLFQ